MSTLNKIGQRLATSLTHQRTAHDARLVEQTQEQKVNVIGAGGALTAVYEQLRNAAENTEEHLLLQSAIRRFYKRLFRMRDETALHNSGGELAIELTFAGYLPNDHLSIADAEKIDTLAHEYFRAHETLLERRSVDSDQAAHWVIDVLAVEVENIISDHTTDTIFLQTAYDYFVATLTPKETFGKQTIANYDVMLYIAIERALLKSDDAMIRTALLHRYKADITDLTKYASINRQIDKLFEHDMTDKLVRLVMAHGAPLRVLRKMLDSHPDIDTLLPRREAFLDEFEKQVNVEYAAVEKRISRAIVRSVIFLIITKVIIGIAIEIPYDIWLRGHIEWIPLAVNLIFPPIYMVLLKFTHQLPGYNNTTMLVERIDQILYGKQHAIMRAQAKRKQYSTVFSAVYAITGLTVFTLVAMGLYLIEFRLVHIIIFFVFLSAASFLGFRLSRLIRELELVRSNESGVTLVRDVFYLPFVIVGRWMSEKYSRVNVVTLILDIVIELPLKTTLRLLRQWAAFIDARKDEL